MQRLMPSKGGTIRRGALVTSRSGTGPGPYCQSGAIGHHTETKLSKITDGISNTYLIGEKYIMPAYYECAARLGWRLRRQPIGLCGL